MPTAQLSYQYLYGFLIIKYIKTAGAPMYHRPFAQSDSSEPYAIYCAEAGLVMLQILRTLHRQWLLVKTGADATVPNQQRYRILCDSAQRKAQYSC
jgi:hypothetical protein